MKKKMLSVLTAIGLTASLLAGCGSNSAPAPAATTAAPAASETTAAPAASETTAAEAKYNLKLSHTRVEDSADHEMAVWFADEVAKRTNGEVSIEIYPNNALGDYETVQERVSMGDIDMFLHGPGVTIDKSLQLSVLPYIIDSWDQAKTYLDTENGLIYTFVKNHFADLDITLLGSNPLYFACFVSGQPVDDYVNPDANHDMKVRVPQNRSFELMAQIFGYIPTPIPATEIYSAMQTGIVEGVFGGGAEAWYGMIRDQIKYIIPMKTHFETHYLGINTEKFNSLPQEYQDLMIQLGKEMQEKGFENAIANEDKYYKLYEDQGTEIYPISDEEITAFANKFRNDAWPELQRNFSDDAVDVLNTIRKEYNLPVVE